MKRSLLARMGAVLSLMLAIGLAEGRAAHAQGAQCPDGSRPYFGVCPDGSTVGPNSGPAPGSRPKPAPAAPAPAPTPAPGPAASTGGDQWAAAAHSGNHWFFRWHRPSEANAKSAVLADCRKDYQDCESTPATTGCFALAQIPGDWGAWSNRDTAQIAEDAALNSCRAKNDKCQVTAIVCGTQGQVRMQASLAAWAAAAHSGDDWYFNWQKGSEEEARSGVKADCEKENSSCEVVAATGGCIALTRDKEGSWGAWASRDNQGEAEKVALGDCVLANKEGCHLTTTACGTGRVRSPDKTPAAK